jgi:hypothetical protein
MAISRPFLLALLGALLLGVTVIAVQSTRSGTDSDTTPAAVQTEPAPAQPTNTNANPAETLNSALTFNGLESASVNARFAIVDRKGDSFRLRLSGAFERGAANDVPKFEADVRMADERQRVRGGFVSLGDRAFFTRGDTGWRVPAQAWTPVVEGVSRGAGLPFEIHPDTWVRNVKSEGTETVGGVETNHVSADVDLKAVVKDLGQAVDAKGATRGVKRASLDAWVGSDDRILRRVSVVVLASDGRMTLDARLTGVNEPQNIDAPARVLHGAPGGLLGQFAGGVVSGATGGTPLAALTSPNPGRAARAVRDHRKVVILFRNPRGLDDRAMRSVMDAVDSRTKALVLTDHVDAVERYGKLVEDLGVSQTPSVVIIDRSGEARLIEGYVDSNTLTQAVTDAR